jgi:hypothetical protein
MLDCHHYDYDWHFLGGKFKKLAIILSFSTTQNVYISLSMYDCSNFVHSCRIFGIHI